MSTLWSMFCPTRAPDWGRPTQYETCVLTQASVYASLAFWGLTLYLAFTRGTTPSLIENSLDSALDLGGSIFVLYRLFDPRSLEPTPRNEMLEARTSIFIAVTMVLLAIIYMSFAAVAIVSHSEASPDDVVAEVWITFPSVVLYLAIGMMQLQLGWTLNCRSIVRDGIISISATMVGVGTLLAGLANFSLWVELDVDPVMELPPPSPPTPLAPVLHTPEYGSHTAGSTSDMYHPSWLYRHRDFNDTSSPFNMFGQRLRVAQMGNKWWWLDHALTVCNALFLMAFGVWFLIQDTSEGARWWRPSFWLAPLPPDSQAPEAAAKHDRVRESAPLVQKS